MKRTIIGFVIGLVLSFTLAGSLFFSELRRYDGTCGPRVMDLSRPCGRIEFLKEYWTYLHPELPKRTWIELVLLIFIPTSFGYLVDSRLKRVAETNTHEEHKSTNV